jgi:hypothetical protein
MAVRRTWKIERGDGSVDAYEDGRAPDEELLAELLTRWSRDLPVGDWSDRALFAAICARRANISPRNAAGMVGLTPEELEDVDIPDGPPWELIHPTEDASVRIVRTEGAPNPGSW